MTLRHIKIFLVVYQEMNITRAAKLLHMTQPAVTRAIHELENHYGFALFERINHKLYRTWQSDELYSYALHIVDSLDLIEKKLKDPNNLGFLRVGASITLGNYLMPEAVSQMQKKYPSLQINVTITSSEFLRQALLNNRIDIAFIEGNFFSDYLCAEPYTEDRLVLIMSPQCDLYNKKDIDLKDLIHYPLLLREKGSAGRNFLEYIFKNHNLCLRPTWESVSTQALVKAVAANLGISILPEQLVKNDIEAGHVVTRNVQDENFIRTNYIFWHKNKHLSPILLEFINICKKISSVTKCD